MKREKIIANGDLLRLRAHKNSVMLTVRRLNWRHVCNVTVMVPAGSEELANQMVAKDDPKHESELLAHLAFCESFEKQLTEALSNAYTEKTTQLAGGAYGGSTYGRDRLRHTAANRIQRSR